MLRRVENPRSVATNFGMHPRKGGVARVLAGVGILPWKLAWA